MLYNVVANLTQPTSHQFYTPKTSEKQNFLIISGDTEMDNWLKDWVNTTY